MYCTLVNPIGHHSFKIERATQIETRKGCGATGNAATIDAGRDVIRLERGAGLPLQSHVALVGGAA